MSDPQPSPPRPPDGAATPGEAARIEQLLVTGLDHYFAGRFDAAIHVWTRVLFLDRHHDRARAYIERARSAQAERHRQGDALLHEGFAAFDRGDVERARELMAQAMAMGASQDAALGVLGRIERLDVGGSSTDDPGVDVARVRRRPRRAWLSPPVSDASEPSAGWRWALAGISLVALFGVIGWVWRADLLTDRWPSPADEVRMSAIPETLGPLPTASVTEAYFRRGQELFDRGRLREALVAFDAVPAGDPLRGAADQMRARIQRELIALALAEPSQPVGSGAQGTPPE